MHRQKFNVRKPGASKESPVPRPNELYCRKCKQAVKRSRALKSGSKRLRCPACGEVLEPRRNA
jgi:hypothetical protein